MSLDDLPEGWRWSTVAEMGQVDLGRQRHPDWHTGPDMHPYLRVANVFEDRIDTSDLMEMDFSGVWERYKLAPGDVLLNEGQTPQLLGRPAIYHGIPENAGFTNTLIRFRVNPDVLPEWALIVFRHYMHSGRFTRESRITTNIAHLSAQRFKAVEFPVPPLDQQQRIVEMLEEHLSRLDSGTAYLSAVERRADRFRVALNRQIFGRYKDARQPLETVVTIENGQTPKGLAELLLESPAHDAVPFFKVGDMNGGDGQSMLLARYFIRRADGASLGLHFRAPGSVLLPKRGGAIATNKKRILTQEAAYDLNTMGLRPSELISAEYLWRWFQGIDLGRIADGSNVPQINARQIKNLSIPVISRDEQETVIRELRDADDAASHVLGELATASKRATQLRRSLLAAAFSGQLVGASVRTEADAVEALAEVIDSPVPQEALL